MTDWQDISTARSFVLGEEYPDWFAGLVAENRAMTHNDDGRWSGGPDHAFVVVHGRIRHFRKGDVVPAFYAPPPNQDGSAKTEHQ